MNVGDAAEIIISRDLDMSGQKDNHDIDISFMNNDDRFDLSDDDDDVLANQPQSPAVPQNVWMPATRQPSSG